MASVEGSMYPLFASEVVPGLPITSLSRETPLAEIWKRAVSGQADEEVVKRPAHVVYSVVPSVDRVKEVFSMSSSASLNAIAHDCRTE